MSPLKALLLVLLSLSFAGCAALSPVEKPIVSLNSINLAPSDGFSQRLEIGIKLDNLNKVDLNLDGLRYKLTLAGSSLAGGSLKQAISLPANDQVSLVLPVDVNLFGGLNLLRKLFSAPSDELDYELSLTALVSNFALGDITINKSGKINIGTLPGIPPASTPAPATSP